MRIMPLPQLAQAPVSGWLTVDWQLGQMAVTVMGPMTVVASIKKS
jgi:hypothetical protein